MVGAIPSAQEIANSKRLQKANHDHGEVTDGKDTLLQKGSVRRQQGATTSAALRRYRGT